MGGGELGKQHSEEELIRSYFVVVWETKDDDTIDEDGKAERVFEKDNNFSFKYPKLKVSLDRKGQMCSLGRGVRAAPKLLSFLTP